MFLKNIYDKPELSADTQNEVFDILCNSNSVRIERIISSGQVTPSGSWYNQELNEWVLLIRGTAVLEFENSGEVRLSDGDYLTIPSGIKHRVTYTSTNPSCIWLAVHYK